MTRSQGDSEQDSLPTDGVVGIETIVPFGSGEEPLDDRASGVAQAVPDEMANAFERLLLAVEGDDRSGLDHRDDEADEPEAPVGPVRSDDVDR